MYSADSKDSSNGGYYSLYVRRWSVRLLLSGIKAKPTKDLVIALDFFVRPLQGFIEPDPSPDTETTEGLLWLLTRTHEAEDKTFSISEHKIVICKKWVMSRFFTKTPPGSMRFTKQKTRGHQFGTFILCSRTMLRFASPLVIFMCFISLVCNLQVWRDCQKRRTQ